MRIEVNGETVKVQSTLLKEVLEDLGYGNAKVATAVNAEFIPVAMRDAHTLNEGDHLEIVAPRQGG